MKNIIKNKFIVWFIVFLMVANITTLTFYWAGQIKNQKDNSPKEFLAKKLNFDESQKATYFDLAKEHNENAKMIRDQIKINKDLFFQLLKSDTVDDRSRNNAALQVSLSIQSLDILTFEHFKKVRALCTNEQKPNFDALVQKMVISVNSPQRGIQPSMKEDTRH
jgi:protein CpxP